jgi:hypothetical protein
MLPLGSRTGFPWIAGRTVRNLFSIAVHVFLVVPTVFFRVLFVFVILSHDRRQPVHVAVTYEKGIEWARENEGALREQSEFPRIPRHSLFKDLALRRIPPKSFESLPSLFSIPTAPTRNLLPIRSL